MITAMLISTLSLAAAPPAELAAMQGEPPVRVWLSKKGSVRAGDRVRVYTRTQSDGYLLVLHAEPDGRIRVLFPLDPLDDNFLRGSQDYELRGRGDREAFRVYESAGVGTILAAYSRDPFQFQAFVRGDHWDYRIFDQWRLTENLDPETELTALAQEMAGGVAFTYDLTSYPVGEKVVYATTYYGASTAWSVGFGVYPGSWGVSFGWGWYDPWWYGYYPYYSHYWYYPYRYAYYYPSCCYYPGYYPPGYYPPSYYPPSGSGTYYRGQYAWKHPSRYDLAGGGIQSRRRTTSRSTASLQPALSQRYATSYTNRRTSPVAGTADGRRASPNSVQTTGRRVSTVQPSASRREAPSSSSALQRRTVSQPTDGSREVRASGWGITDGRRVIRPTERPTVAADERAAGTEPERRPTAITPARPDGDGAGSTATRRSAGGGASTSARTGSEAGAASSSALARRNEASRIQTIRSQVSRSAPMPDRSSATRRQVSTTTRSTVPSRSTIRSTTPTRRATPSLSRRSVSPSRSSAPRPSVNRAPAPRASRPAPASRAPTRKAPARRKR